MHVEDLESRLVTAFPGDVLGLLDKSSERWLYFPIMAWPLNVEMKRTRGQVYRYGETGATSSFHTRRSKHESCYIHWIL